VELGLTIILLGITVVLSWSAFTNERLFEALLFDPYRIRTANEWYRFFTHALLHSDVPHLVVNMFVLFAFGRNVELLYHSLVGSNATWAFLGLYVGGALFSSLPAMLKYGSTPGYRAVGASGAVSAVLFAQILLLPFAPVRVMLVPIDLPSWVFGALYLFYSWYMDKRGGDNVAHDAHLHGALFGMAFTAFLAPDALFRFGNFQFPWMP
jgi:membrane associated rhomboid family serine protease